MDYDLDDLIREKTYDLNISRIRLIMSEILKGVEYLHRNYVVHRDIKSITPIK
jgi:serine/threonine protein kinase